MGQNYNAGNQRKGVRVTMRFITGNNSMMMEMYMCGMCKMMHAQKCDSPCVLSV